MADRDRYDWDRNRDDIDRERARRFDRDRGAQDRGMMERGTDEVRSWLGDDEAQRRRDTDEARDRQQERAWGRTSEGDRYSERDRAYGANSDQARREHGWTGPSRQSASRPSEPRWSEPHRTDRSAEQNWSGAAGSAFNSDYSIGAPNWSGSPSRETRSYSSEGFGRSPQDQGRHRSSSEGYGGYRPEQSSSSFTGGYGSTFAGRGPRNYQRSDDRIREDVSECLTADPRIDASEIDVRVERGEVILSGTVEGRRLRRLAEEIIEELPGVRDVRNDLRVSPMQTAWTSDGQSGRRDSREREDGALGNTGDPQKRDDVTTLNSSGSGKINE